MIAFLRTWAARRRLERMIAQTRSSYECRRYRERRAAALKGRARMAGG